MPSILSKIIKIQENQMQDQTTTGQVSYILHCDTHSLGVLNFQHIPSILQSYLQLGSQTYYFK